MSYLSQLDSQITYLSPNIKQPLDKKLLNRREEKFGTVYLYL